MAYESERLTDICDIADLEIERSINRAVKKAQDSVNKPLQNTGKCLYCSELVESGRWCDTDCRDDWDYLQDRNKSRGKL